MTNPDQLPIPHAGLDDNLRSLSTLYSVEYYLPYRGSYNSKITVIDSLKYREEPVILRYCRHDALMKALLHCDACNVWTRGTVPNLDDLIKMAFGGQKVLLIITTEDEEREWEDFIDFDARERGFNAQVTWWR